MNATITNPLNLILIILGTFLSITIGFFLLLNASPKNKANRFLGILLLVISTSFTSAFLYRFDLLDNFPHFIFSSIFTSFLLGPLSYLYVCACTQKDFQFRGLSWLHILPFVLDVLFFSPMLLLSGPVKVDLYINSVLKGDFIQSSYLFITKTIHAVVYMALAVRMVIEYRKHLSNTASNIDVSFHRWMLAFLFLMALPIISYGSRVLIEHQKLLVTFALLVLVVFLLSLYFVTLIKPELFHAFPHQMATPDSEEVQKEKYESSKLAADQKDAYLQKLVTFVEQEKPYQAPELTLPELADKVRIPPHYVSQVINEKLQVNFLDFINGYRVKDAQEKLNDPNLSHYTILAIAYEVGFNAKSTFYSVFKKHTGMTPSEYRRVA